MNRELIDKLDSLEQKIKSGGIEKETSSVKEWGGADDVIRKRLNDSVKKMAR